MQADHTASDSTENLADINAYSVNSHREEGLSSFSQPENTVYQSRGCSPDVVEHVHPAAAVGQSLFLGAGKDSQIASLTAPIEEVRDQVGTIAETIETHLKRDGSEQVRETIRDWSEDCAVDRPFAVAARYATLAVLLKSTLYEWYAHRGDLPFLNGNLRDAFDEAADRTKNHAFKDAPLVDIAWEIPRERVAEISWWRHGLMTAENPADDLGYLFEELIPAAERKKHGQFTTPRRISAIMRELAVCDDEQVLDAGIGAGALSVPRDSTMSAHTYGVEQSRLGFLLAVTSLALAEQPGVVHHSDFFDITPGTLGMNPDATLKKDLDSGDVDIVPGQVDAAIGNPPYVANRNLEKETRHYRQHLSAFGKPNKTSYLDGEKKLSGRSDLFVYFITHATQFLVDGGRLVYLLPTKWMETQYGQTLQAFLFDHYQVSAIIRFDDTVFNDAQVNAVLLVAKRCDDATVRRNTTTRFLTITGELAPAAINDLVFDGSVSEGESTESNDTSSHRENDYRVITVSQSVLEERDASDGPLTQYFRETGTLRALQQTEELVSLDTLASVQYGEKTGHNEFFLLDDADLDTWPLADRFYRSALDDFGTVSKGRLTASDSDTYILDIHAYIESLDDQATVEKPDNSRAKRVKQALIQNGHNALVAYLDHWATRADNPGQDNGVWFDARELHAPDLVHPYRIHQKTQVVRNAEGLVPTNCANGIDVKPSVDMDALLGYLNSTLHAAFLEMWGQSEGGGSLEVTTGTLGQLPVADVRAFSDKAHNNVVTAYQALIQGENYAQAKLDKAVLDAIDADINAMELRAVHSSLMHERLSST
ncbi:Eco57I restriction-modification methylase domain-containing protein [Halosimplex pelagicum]|uniref:site-specific DNA-methyltransferase (adenine-specific) n=1 Tax=Halosimplex pelagicum TaxID=869886 RepID=A0A7D5PDR4_9EURY|nr:N-6 DNA methylase [Halosimplex pelagicum]QLH83838.1 N-6 DNA methylase [Halosimplex pelagicum]